MASRGGVLTAFPILSRRRRRTASCQEPTRQRRGRERRAR